MIPPLPDIEGAVLEGVFGDEEDNPYLFSAFYGCVEYWMPHQASALWLMAELSADHPAGP
jgi:recombinational DNA repair protein (RecF pathway)